MIILLVGGGCWNRKEPESLALVMGIGVDYDQESKEYEVVVDIAKPTPVAGDSGGGGGQGDGSIVASARGKSMFEAMRQIEPSISRVLFWGHSEELIVSENLARRGIQPVFDLYSRERQTRLSNFILVTGDDLKELLQIKLPLETETGIGIRRQIQTIQVTQTVIPNVDMRTVLVDFNRPGKEIFVPRIHLKKEPKPGEESPGGEGSSEGGGGQLEGDIEIAGGAAFCDDRMIGWVNPEATQGWLYITGNISRATEMIPCPNPECDSFLAVEIHRVFSRQEVTLADGGLRVKVEISVEGRLQEKDCTAPYDEIYEKKLHKLLAESVRKKAQTAVNRAQELRSDIFGFGNAFYRKYPREWENLESHWREHFVEIEVEIKTKANILRPGLVVEPPKR